MNKVMLIGRLTADPVVRSTAGEKPTSFCRFTLAVENPFKKTEPKADFISCQAWGRQADLMGKYLVKGSKVGVVGRIQTGKYQKNGDDVYTEDVVMQELIFLDNKQTDGKASQTDDFMSIPDGLEQELPFV